MPNQRSKKTIILNGNNLKILQILIFCLFESETSTNLHFCGGISQTRGTQLKHHGGPKIFLRPIKGPNLVRFFTFKGNFNLRKKIKYTQSWALRAKLKASTGHICPAGRMLCMSDLN